MILGRVGGYYILMPDNTIIYAIESVTVCIQQQTSLSGDVFVLFFFLIIIIIIIIIKLLII